MLTIEPIQMGITAFRLTGSLDAMAVQVFDDEILYNIRENPFVILDLEPLHFLSSAGIRKLVSLEKELRKKGGYSVLSGASPQILQVLEISGLTAQFHLTTSLKAAEETIERDSDQGLLKQDLRMEDRSYNLTRFDGAGSVVNGRPASGSFAGKLCFVSLNELGYAMGEGCFSSGRQQALDTMGPFISLPGFFAYHPASDEKVTDFQHIQDQDIFGVYVDQFLGVSGDPSYFVEISGDQGINNDVLIDDLFTLVREAGKKTPPVMGVTAFLDFGETDGAREIRLCQGLMVMNAENQLSEALQGIRKHFREMEQDGEMHYVRRSLLLNGLETLPEGEQLDKCLHAVLDRHEIGLHLTSPPEKPVVSGKIWLFLPKRYQDHESQRSHLKTEDGKALDDNWDLIVRSIYKDHSSVLLQPLHGGFSAKTFMVESYDKNGKKLLPTVLKLGNTAMIRREEKRYHESVQPFILNNSVSVLGAKYYGGMGGICYNFLGIGGPESNIRWLTHLYREWTTENLIPLFDRIFKGILKPWYGQPRWEKRFLFKEHDPRKTFFPKILEDAGQYLDIDADDKYLTCKYLGREVLNPYWYLKHVWGGRENEAFHCYTSVCHGDLNMQNILIDEKENIYIIDFSETEVKNNVSDFARLEPIFKIEMTRSGDENDLTLKLQMEEKLVRMSKLGEPTEFFYTGDDPQVAKAWEMVTRVRKYAKQVTIFEEDPLPYWLPVLEWTLPYVSYIGVSKLVQWHAVYSAGLICEQLMQG